MKKKLYTALEILFTLVFCFSLYSLIRIGLDYKKGEDIYNVPQKEFVKENTQKDIPEKYAKYLDVYVDVPEIKKSHENVIGWIYVKDTGINYPLVAADGSNDYYLSHTFDGKESRFGAIFIDWSCAPDLSDINTVIHGHNTKDGSMFGTLRKFRDQDFYNAHPYVFIFLEDHINVYEVYKQKTTKVASELYFVGKDEQTRITLSTCTSRDKSNRYVVIARLVDQI